MENESLDLVLETAIGRYFDQTTVFIRKENLILAVRKSFPVNRKLQPYTDCPGRRFCRPY